MMWRPDLLDLAGLCTAAALTMLSVLVFDGWLF
jgi:hypothetical protein